MDNPASSPLSASAGRTTMSSVRWRALRFEPELFPDDETLMREVLDGGPPLEGITLERLRPRARSASTCPRTMLPSPTGCSRRPRASASSTERMQADGLDPLPTYTPPLEDPQTRPELAGRPPAIAEPAAAPVPELDLRQQPSPPRRGRRAGIELAAEDAGSAASPRASGPRSSTTAARSRPGSTLTGNVRPGVAVATGIYWNKLSPGRSNVNSTTSSALTDMGAARRSSTTWSRFGPSRSPSRRNERLGEQTSRGERLATAASAVPALLHLEPGRGRRPGVPTLRGGPPPFPVLGPGGVPPPGCRPGPALHNSGKPDAR